MFGYITLNKPEMKVKNLEAYQACYCGLCHELQHRFGVKAQLLLSYDCTFLTLLLDGVYEPEAAERSVRCLRHPIVRAYAKDYRKLKSLWPRQEKAIRRAVADLSRLEHEPVPEGKDEILQKLDQAAACTGRFLAEVCAPRNDLWAEDLRGVGFYLGKFIYILDAWDDRKKDQKSGNYNLLAALEAEEPEYAGEIVKEVLCDMAARCCRSFERLPIVKNVEILRNILYSGIWVKIRIRLLPRNGSRRSSRPTSRSRTRRADASGMAGQAPPAAMDMAAGLLAAQQAATVHLEASVDLAALAVRVPQGTRMREISGCGRPPITSGAGISGRRSIRWIRSRRLPAPHSGIS